MVDWARAPLETYEQWLSTRSVGGRAYAAQTRRQYRAMFAAFVRWLVARGSTLLDVDGAGIEAFLGDMRGRAGAAAARTQRIYLLEIERVLAHLRAQGLREDNPAHDLIARMRQRAPLKPRNSALVGLDVRLRYLELLSGLQPSALPMEQVRAHAMALLMLELGLTLKEVQKLTLADVADIDAGWIVAPGHRHMRRRTLPIRGAAWVWLRHWLRVRQDLRVLPVQARARKRVPREIDLAHAQEVTQPGVARVFVVLRSGFAERAQRRSAINRIGDLAVREAAVAAIMSVKPDWPANIVRGPQMLRNLCFLRLLYEDMPQESIADFLGLRDVQQVRLMARMVARL